MVGKSRLRRAPDSLFWESLPGFMEQQHTVARAISFVGIGLHSGLPARAVLLPAPPDQGIVFVRTDLPGSPSLFARVENVASTDLATTLGGEEGARIATVEHLIAACAGLQVDNALIEVDGPEIPVLDGSALPFAQAILAAGRARQGQRRRRVTVVRPIERTCPVTGRYAALLPDPGFVIDCAIDFPHPLIGAHSFCYIASKTNFLKDLAPARTFGMLAEVEAMRARNLARGGSLENAVVFDLEGVRNPEGLRFPDEPARHKTLDALGDLALLGAPLRGRLVTRRSGHAWNLALMALALQEGAVVREEPVLQARAEGDG